MSTTTQTNNNYERPAWTQNPAIVERLESKIEHNVNEQGCDKWTGHIGDPERRNDYGKVSINGEWVRAHRKVYELYIGPIPDDKPLIHHDCGNKWCQEPEHLRAVTYSQNMEYAAEKGQYEILRGEDHGSSKLSAEDAVGIILLEEYTDYTQDKIGAKHGVSDRTVRDIRYGDTWRHLTHPAIEDIEREHPE